jgi:carbonic anhydrase
MGGFIMQKLIEGLHKFHSEVSHSHRDLFRSLSKGQHPEALFITCSDSRINPNLITQTQPGDLFILRNAGNIVPSYGLGSSGEAATIEFAVAGLGVKHIIVCGHTLCGAMRGLLDPASLEDTPAVKAWLQNAEMTRRLVVENYPEVEGQARLTLAVEENVLAQIENLRTHPCVRSRLARGELSLYAWVYKIETGEVFQYEHEKGQFMHMANAAPASAIPETLLKRRSI